MKLVKKLFNLKTVMSMVLSSTIAVIFSLSGLCGVEAAGYKLPFEPNSKAIYMLNLDTDTVVYEQNADLQLPPASLTKVMTAIVALESITDLEGTVVKAPSYLYDEFYGLNVSNADIKQGEEVRMLDLLYALMLPSACEAASIIADYIGDGNITEFVELMNKKAKELGANDTVFMNAHGLYNEQQVTTARDIAAITKYALDIPMFVKITSTRSYQMPATNKHAEPYYITHTNHMMSKTRGGDLYYEYVKGVKTGSLPEVGKNLVSTASKDGYNYLLATIGAPDKDANGAPYPKNGAFVDAKKLYEWAFSSFKQTQIVRQGEVVDETSVKLGQGQDFVTLLAKEDISALLPVDSDITTIQRIKQTAKDVRAPVKQGTVLGVMDLKLNDEIIASVDLVASEDVERSVLLYSLDVAGRFLQNTLVQILLGVLLLLIVLFMLMKARYRKIRRLRNERLRSQIKNDQ